MDLRVNLKTRLLQYSKSKKNFSNYLLFFSLLLLSWGLVQESEAVTRFSTNSRVKQLPAPINFDDIWFYDQEKKKVIPEVNPTWIAVVFRSPVINEGNSPPEEARMLQNKYKEITEIFYDNNLAEDACFYRLRKDLKIEKFNSLLKTLNNEKEVDYVHPVINLQNRTYAFFNVFKIKWKTGADEHYIERLLKQVFVVYDEREKVYRVDIYKIPYFKALNLLAEDIMVSEIVPYLVEVKPSIKVVLSLSMQGANLGDTIPFLITVEFTKQVSIDPSSLANIDLKPETLQRDLFELQFDPYDYVKISSISPIRITGWMRFYAPGEFVIPPVRVKYTCLDCSGAEVRSVESNPLPIRIASIIPSQQKGSTLIVPSDPLQPNFYFRKYQEKSKRYLYIALISFLLTAGCLILLIWNLKVIKSQLKRVQERKSEEIVREKLRIHLTSQPPGAHWIYLVELGYLFREYLTTKYQISQDPRAGSGEVFFRAAKDSLPEFCREKVYKFLKEIDNKIALELEQCPDLGHLQKEVNEIIDIL